MAEWTPEEDADLHRMWMIEGRSFRQIADRMGRSRASVMGRAHRKRWKRTDPQASRELSNTQRRGNHGRHPPTPPVQCAIDLAQVGYRIMDPEFGGCRWPLSGEGAETRFCCQEPDKDSPYCERHHQRSRAENQPSPKEFSRIIRLARRAA